MFFIVLVHAVEFARTPGTPKALWEILLSVFIRFTVPAFFVISGLLLQKSLEKADAVPKIGTFLYKKFTTLMVPFFAWNIIYMFVFKLVFKWSVFSAATGWNLATGYMHLYYVFVLIQFFIFYPLAYPVLKKRGPSFALGAGALFSLSFFMVSEYLLWSGGPDGHFFEWHAGKLFAGWSLFFFWGTFLANHPEIFTKIKKQWPWLGLATVVLLGLYLMETRLQIKIQGEISRDFFLISGLPFQFAGATFFLIIMDKINCKIPESSFLKRINRSGKDTFGIYLAHVALLALSGYAIGKIDYPIAVYLKIPIMVILAWTACQAVVRLCRRPGFELFNRLLFGSRG